MILRSYTKIDKKKNRKLANIRPSLHFYGMTILVETKPLCKGMAWLPFKKCTYELIQHPLPACQPI